MKSKGRDRSPPKMFTSGSFQFPFLSFPRRTFLTKKEPSDTLFEYFPLCPGIPHYFPLWRSAENPQFSPNPFPPFSPETSPSRGPDSATASRRPSSTPPSSPPPADLIYTPLDPPPILRLPTYCFSTRGFFAQTFVLPLRRDLFPDRN